MEKAPLTLVVSCEGPPYMGAQWRRAPLDWWSLVKGTLTLVLSDEGPHYIGAQWLMVLLYWCSVVKDPLMLMLSGNVLLRINSHL